ncbi:TetR/AcrR family transcriptional regulator [Actinoalloteichus caeruleus]|uniref:TetR/AcrR family transcriptional regulator n=1 Tax=Actinoalloteichus cyanogriseus TaxID=2893586 RepID=UPI003AAA9A31
MAVIGGRGDADLTMRLLWAGSERGPSRSAPGPRQSLTASAIVEAAIGLADEEGLAGLSMRAVGERLGRSAMALYTYVPGKAELVDLMYDQAHADFSGACEEAADWRSGVLEWAVELRDLYLRHPWVLQVSHARPVLGPHEQVVFEALAGLLRSTELPGRVLRGAVSALFHHVRGSARTAAEAGRAAAETGVPDREWWTRRSTLLREVAPDFAERFPHSVRLAGDASAGQGGGTRDSAGTERAERGWARGVDAVFVAGLTVLLDGLSSATGVDGRGEASEG